MDESVMMSMMQRAGGGGMMADRTGISWHVSPGGTTKVTSASKSGGASGNKPSAR